MKDSFFEQSNQLIAAHIPVIHRGYLDLINTFPDTPVGIFDGSITEQFDYLRKDIRTIPPEVTVDILKGIGRPAFLLGAKSLESLIRLGNRQLIMPKDDLSDSLIKQHQTSQTNIQQVPIFLRWDRTNVETNAAIEPDRTIEVTDEIDEIIHLLNNEAEKSTDWWRHVSAALVQNGSIMSTSYNHALPSEYSHYIDGDPRITQKRGSNIEASLFVHAESSLIAKMAKEGRSTEGTSLYVSTFPCPNCAKLIASSGISHCYYLEGYAMLDGFDVMKSAGVEIIKINTPESHTDTSSRALPYPS